MFESLSEGLSSIGAAASGAVQQAQQAANTAAQQAANAAKGAIGEAQTAVSNAATAAPQVPPMARLPKHKKLRNKQLPKPVMQHKGHCSKQIPHWTMLAMPPTTWRTMR